MAFLHDCQRIKGSVIEPAAGMHLEVIPADLPSGAEFIGECFIIEIIRYDMTEHLRDTIHIAGETGHDHVTNQNPHLS